MGYESKFYIVQKYSKHKEDKKRYAQVIAMFDMCKMWPLNVFKTETDCYFYADDGNTQVLEDCYGDPLKEASIKEVIDMLEEAVENGEDYRRIFPLLAALKVIEEQLKRNIWEDVVVLHYGH